MPKPYLTLTSRRSRSAQVGGVLIMFAFWLGIALAGLMVLDIGNLFWQKREIQKIADPSALSGAANPVATLCPPQARSVAQANGLQAQDTFQPVAGFWGAGSGGVGVQFQPNASNPNACNVVVKRVVDYFFLWPASAGSNRELTAEATAVTSARVARLSIRTQLAQLNSQDSVLLNGLVGGLLGGDLNVGLMGWQGLANLDVSLLSYLQALAIDLNLDAGGYDQLLNTEVGVGVLLTALISAVERDGSVANVSLQALEAIQAQAQLSNLRLKLADLLNVQTGLPSDALRTDLNVLQLVQGVVQVANGNSAVAGAIAIPLPGVLDVRAFLQVIEPPQLSAIGDPELAKQQPRGANQLFVRSAQTRVLLSVNLPVLGALTTLINAVTVLISPVLALVNGITGGGFSGLPDANVLPAPVRIDVSLDVGNGQAYLTDYSCSAAGKSVTMQTRTSAIDLRLGKWGETAEDARNNAFASQSLAPIGPITVVRLDCLGCHGQSLIPQYFGGQGLKLDLPVLRSADRSLTVQPANDLTEPINWDRATSSTGVIRSLGSTVLGLKILETLPADPRAPSAGVRGLLDVLNTVFESILSLVNGLIVMVLAPILDPILDSLLKLLGIRLAGAEYGAQLNCGAGAELVY